MDREKALSLVKQNVKNRNLVKHMLATEAVMSRLARHFGEDAGLWGMIGLVHDIDYDQTLSTPEQHGLLGARILEEKGFPEMVLKALKSHNPLYEGGRDTMVEKALYAVDPVTGFIVAAALIHSDKKLSSIDVSFLLNRIKEKGFARGANRDQIRSCVELGLSLEEFLEISLEAMQAIDKELGL